MPSLIIGLVGLQGCGKGAAADYLATTYQAETFKFSAILKETLEKLAIDPRRENFTKLSGALRSAFGEDALSFAITRNALQSKASVVIVDGIRRIEDLSGLETSPHFHLIEIHATPERRFERMKARGEKSEEKTLTWDQFLASEHEPNEKTVPQVTARAQIHVDNNGDLAYLYQQLDQVMASIDTNTKRL